MNHDTEWLSLSNVHDAQIRHPQHLIISHSAGTVRVLDHSRNTSSLWLISRWFMTDNLTRLSVEKAELIRWTHCTWYTRCFPITAMISPSFDFSISARDCGLMLLSESLYWSGLTGTIPISPAWCNCNLPIALCRMVSHYVLLSRLMSVISEPVDLNRQR